MAYKDPEEARAYARAYRAAHREKVQAYNRAYYAAHREQAATYSQSWRDANREAKRVRDRAYRAKHYERSAAQKRARYAVERGEVIAKAKAWRVANPEKYRAINRDRAARRKARKIGAGVFRFTLHDWVRMLARYRNACAYCGTAGILHQEHVIPLSRGGRHAAGNIVPACPPCNFAKGTMLLTEWRYRSRRSSGG